MKFYKIGIKDEEMTATDESINGLKNFKIEFKVLKAWEETDLQMINKYNTEAYYDYDYICDDLVPIEFEEID